MVSQLAHRGPDSFGSATLGRVSFGFRRLAINDPENGSQPFFSDDGKIVAVCNGEIFNHRTLRATLARDGHRFRTRCDTEVLIPLYHKYGTGLAERLDGQFAFALYDSTEERLLLARDHAGIAPLFYTVAAGRLVFGSEIKALLRYPGTTRRVDPRGLDQVLTLPGLVSPRTMFEGIHALRPGEQLIADRFGIRTERYWDLDYAPLSDAPSGVAGSVAGAHDPRDELDCWAERAGEVLGRAVRSRLMADVPVGMYLSGGLDSSLIAARLADVRPGHPWPSFAVAFPGRPFDESAYQQLVARKVGTEHYEIEVSEADLGEWFGTMVRHAECPVRESYNVCSLLLSRAARRAGTVVVLSGEGADELFGGYPGYRFSAAGLAGHRPAGPEVQLEREIRRRMWGTDIRYEQDHLPAQELRRELYAPDLAASLDTFSVTAQRLVDPERLVGRHPLHQRSYLDFHLRLTDHLLGDHGDRMAYANGVEPRFPFLAREMVEFATTVPPALMVHEGQEKAVLRRAAKGTVPGEVLSRTKYGFRAHTSSHLLAAGAEWFEELIAPSTLRRQGYFDAGTVTELARRQRTHPERVHAHLDADYLMVIASFALFVEEFGLPCLG